MKKKLLTTLISISMTLGMTLIPSFAETEQGYIDDMDQLKSVLQQDVTAEALTDNVAPEVAAEFMEEKLEQAAILMNGQEIAADLQRQADGSLYDRQSFDLGDGCELVVELCDKSEVQSGDLFMMPSTAASTSNPQWYGYGNRSFTAKASVNCAVGTAYMNLTNNYTLSASGIDERPGVASSTCSKGGVTISHTAPQITDSAARTPGASDVNMHCVYTLRDDSGKLERINKYKLNTTIGFLDINKSTKKVRVRHSWNLAKVS